MNRVTKTMAAGAVVLSFVGAGFADPASASLPLQPANPAGQMAVLQKPNPQHCQKNRMGHALKHSFDGSWFGALRHSRQLTADQAKTVAQAAVIMYGDSSMQVGSVTPVAGNHGHQNYRVQITNTAGKVLTTLTMNGMNGRIIPQNP